MAAEKRNLQLIKANYNKRAVATIGAGPSRRNEQMKIRRKMF
jgi:hypothetical protein